MYMCIQIGGNSEKCSNITALPDLPAYQYMLELAHVTDADHCNQTVNNSQSTTEDQNTVDELCCSVLQLYLPDQYVALLYINKDW